MHSQANLHKMIPLLLALIVLLVSSITPTESMALPGCPGSCGNLSIPFPFGITSDCYLDPSFLINCNSSFSPPKPFLHPGKAEVLNISLDGKIKILNSSSDLMELDNRGNDTVPLVIEWAAGNVSCLIASGDASRYACQAQNSVCKDSSSGRGYICQCLPGFQGNPFLVDGCKDINECHVLDPCRGICTNLPGSFKCHCPEGFIGDGRKDGTGCHPKNQVEWFSGVIYFPIGILLLAPALYGTFIFSINREKKLAKQRENLFLQNGGDVLMRKLSKRKNPAAAMKIFTADAMKKVTSNYHKSTILRRDGQSTFYRGISPEDSKEIVVKKIPKVPQPQIHTFVEKLNFFSQPHPNIVRIMGCCLETDLPLLAYDVNPDDMDKTLAAHMHSHPHRVRPQFTLANRVKAAVGVARALAHSLSGKSGTKIVHGPFNSRSILLDDSSGEAKILDTLSSLQENRVHSHPDLKFTEKSDVYSFGVVLAELLLGDKALNLEENDRIRGEYFVSSVKNDRLSEILDEQLMDERDSGLVTEIAMLAEKCLSVKPEERPTVKKVKTRMNELLSLTTGNSSPP